MNGWNWNMQPPKKSESKLARICPSGSLGLHLQRLWSCTWRWKIHFENPGKKNMKKNPTPFLGCRNFCSIAKAKIHLPMIKVIDVIAPLCCDPVIETDTLQLLDYFRNLNWQKTVGRPKAYKHPLSTWRELPDNHKNPRKKNTKHDFFKLSKEKEAHKPWKGLLKHT